MVKREPIYLDDNKFKTKKDCKIFVKDIINNIIFNEIIDKDHKHFKIFLDLIKRHPNKENKIGEGVLYFVFLKDVFKLKRLYVMRLDNTLTELSWCKCIKSV
jgi:hypothetical protein